MIVYQANLQMSLAAVVGPDAGTNGSFASGALNLGAAISEQFSGVTNVLAARLNFGASGATGQVDYSYLYAGFASATAGSPQIETATVTAAAGATSSGNLVVTLTGAGLTGSPVAINVPLVTGTHTTATLIAAAIAATLNAHTASLFPTLYTAAGVGATVVITSIHPRANDATLNLAIAAGLGVSAAASSANSNAGVAGSSVDLPTVAVKDSFASSLGAFTTLDGFFIRVTGSNSVLGIGTGGCTPIPPIAPGKALLWQAAAANTIISLQASGPTFADVLAFGH